MVAPLLTDRVVPMYHSEPPSKLKPNDLEAIEECPASVGPKSKMPRAALDRWLAVRYALEEALANGGDVDVAVDANADWLDPLQRELVAELVSNGVILLGTSDAEVLFDPDDNPVTVDHPDINAELVSYVQVDVTDPHDASKLERLKIKTGKQGTSPAEAAILLSGSDPGVSFADLMLRDGTIEPIERSDDERDKELERLFGLAVRERDLKDRRPGWQCYLCDRVARCGQYPAPAGYKVGTRQRTIRISKSDVLRLDECHRRIAWKALHVIPSDAGDEAGPGAAIGLLFHEAIANVLVADDQEAAFTEELDRVSPEDRPILETLFERHRQIEADHVAVQYKLTEYPVGATFILAGLDADRDGNVTDGASVAITVIARTDAVGRERDGTPAVIEHRTGKTSDRIDERETALYAVSVARLLDADSVAVHQHSLGGEDDPECLRIVYDDEALAKAEELLASVLAPIATWHPLDATDPVCKVGEWCTGCPYQERCERFRG